MQDFRSVKYISPPLVLGAAKRLLVDLILPRSDRSAGLGKKLFVAAQERKPVFGDPEIHRSKLESGRHVISGGNILRIDSLGVLWRVHAQRATHRARCCNGEIVAPPLHELDTDLYRDLSLGHNGFRA